VTIVHFILYIDLVNVKRSLINFLNRSRLLFNISCFGLLVSLLSSSCSENKADNIPNTLFHKIENSGINFINRLDPTLQLSAFDFIYYQNGGGVAVADFDLDGFEDVFLTSNLHSDRLYRNLGELKFEDITQQAGVDGFAHGIKDSWSTGVTITDINDDGLPDIYICKSGKKERGRETQNVLYVNNGNLTFTERSKEYGLNEINHSTQATFFDYDNDGDLDAFILNHSPMFGKPDLAYQMDKFPQSLKPFSNSFFINDNGKYREATEEAGLMTYSYGLGVVASDINADGWTDLFTTNDFSRPDKMYVNNQKGGFADVMKECVGHISQYSMGCDVADINNDGLLDISVVDMAPANNYRSKTQMPSMSKDDFKTYTETYGYTHQYMNNSLLLNQGENKFSEIAKLSGTSKTDWSWSSLLADFDNDGYKDLFITNGYLYNRMENDFAMRFDSMMRANDQNPDAAKRKEWMTKPPSYKLSNYGYKNVGDLQFENQTENWGLSEKTYSNGSAYSDLDNDGDLDLIVNNLNSTASVYENNSTQNYLQIEFLSDDKSNLSKSLNTSITIYAKGNKQFQEQSLTRGFQSASSSILNFGFGEIEMIDSIVIQKFSGLHTMYNIASNQRLKVDLNILEFIPPETTLDRKAIFNKTNSSDLTFLHQENDYDDFEKEMLLPHRNSRFGPFMSAGDVNTDGLDDFYIGGASGQASVLYIQKEDRSFDRSSQELWSEESQFEDMRSCFFDLDYDGDLDLYVVSGGNAWPVNDPHYMDRLYLNDGNGNFKKSNLTWENADGSGSIVQPISINGDNYLFVGGRMLAQKYPYSTPSALLLIEKGQFLDVTKDLGASFQGLGIVTDAISGDINGDGKDELIVVGEWMNPEIFEYQNGKFINITSNVLRENTGWWNTIEAVDLDNDGDLDLIAGNLGLNYKYTASTEKPFTIYADDLDKSGEIDIVLSYQSNGIEYPVRGRECSSEQMQGILKSFPTYHEFASSSVQEIYGAPLANAMKLTATEFGSCIFWNDGLGSFTKDLLPLEAQLSSVNSIISDDFNKDGFIDLLLAGNMFSSEVETPRNDASYGCLLLGNGQGDFNVSPNYIHGFYANKDIKDLQKILLDGQRSILVGNNKDSLQIWKY
jgi:hypothetical protein